MGIGNLFEPILQLKYLSRKAVNVTLKEVIYRKKGALHLESDKCIKCGLCCEICVGNALNIQREDKDSELKLTFDYRNCFQCGLCVDICPQDALFMIDRLGYIEQRDKNISIDKFTSSNRSKATFTKEISDILDE